MRDPFSEEHIRFNCFLCDYCGHDYCDICPIEWPDGTCYRTFGMPPAKVDYRFSPISEILALPTRNKKFTDEKAAYYMVGTYYQFREALLSQASGIPASAAIDDHVKAIQEKAVQQSTFSKMYCDAKTELAKASGLPEADTITDHIKAIQEKAVDDYFARMPLAKAMTTDIDEAFKQHAEEQKAPIFRALAEASGLSATNKSVEDHISKIKEWGVREGRLEVAEEIYGKLAEASGLSESNHDVQDHVGKIIEKTRIESADCTRKFMAKYSGELWDRFTVVGHIEKIKRDANAKYAIASSLLEKYKDALSNESGLDRGKPVDVHIREIVKNSMEVGAADERDRIQEKIEELLKE